MITLAWLPLPVSVTLCSILSVTLIASAIVSEWRSWTLSAMALVAILMIWRGEAWKAVFLQAEQQVSELRLPPPASISPRKGFSYSSPELLHDDCRYAVRLSFPQLFGLSSLNDLHIALQSFDPQNGGTSCGLLEAVSELPVARQDSTQGKRPILWRYHSLVQFEQPLRLSQIDVISVQPYDVAWWKRCRDFDFLASN
jgi:hypothetical protein